MNKLIRFFSPQKRQELIFLSLVVFIAITTLVISHIIAKKIENQEKAQVILWARAITEKAKILKLSNAVFLKLAEEERKKVEITSKATQLIISESDDKIISLFLDIIRLNDQIPIIYTNQDLIITDSRNIENGNKIKGEKLSKKKYPDFFRYPPVEIQYGANKNYIFYKESIIFQNISKIIEQSSSQFIDEITNNSSLLPIILVDEKKQLLNYGNIPENILSDSISLKKYVTDFIESQEPISIEIDPQSKKYLYYQRSPIASYIKWFPIGLYSILGVLFLLTYIAIRNARKFEKNQIWVGMSKETAHQLGTPISSLSAWLEVFNENEKLTPSQMNVLHEMRKDISRLSLIADRFSKIGSKPKLELVSLDEILNTCIDYLKKRAPKKITIQLDSVNISYQVEINRQLFEWVIENLVKNAFDAISNEGIIHIETSKIESNYAIDISDTGKGMLPSEFEKIFEPGYTTKKRGWGLGLSLCKRIIVDYFNGNIFVLKSKLHQGTTIRILLKSL